MTLAERAAEVIELYDAKHTAVVYGDSSRLTVAPDASLEDATINLACGSITIGRGTFCGHRVMLLTGSHKLNGKRPTKDVTLLSVKMFGLPVAASFWGHARLVIGALLGRVPLSPRIARGVGSTPETLPRR